MCTFIIFFIIYAITELFRTNNLINLFFLLSATPVMFYGLYLMHNECFTFTRIIIYENGFIPPMQSFFNFIDKDKHMIFFNDISEMSIYPFSNDQIKNNFKLYLNNNKRVDIEYNQLDTFTLDFFLKLKREQFPDKRRQFAENAFRLTSEGNNEKALELINKAIDINPNSKNYWHIKGGILGDMKRFQESLDAYEKSLSIFPDASDWENKGDALEGLGRFQEAVECYNKALKLKRFNKSVIRMKRDRIKNYLLLYKPASEPPLTQT